jgi:flagellar biosynthesis regulator FlaF
LLAHVEREVHEQMVLGRPQRDPLYWSEVIANATVFLLVRDDLPLTERQQWLRARAGLLPAFARQCSATFARAKSDEVAPELCKIAVGQLRATAIFYQEGFARAVGGNPEARDEGAKAATAISELADNIEKLSQGATGSPRLGREYATTFRLGTGSNEPVADVLKRATADLAAKKTEAANFGRKVWRELMEDKEPPADDAVLLRRLFERVAEDRDTNEEAYASRWKADVVEIEKFVRKKRIMTLPDPLTLVVDRAPAYFVGQSFGGVYPAGPYSPEAKTILFLPVPPPDATAQQREAFFRDFNRPFSRMIVPHELIPGHYVQLKYAARNPHKVRAVFPDPVYVEGWGTFCERLLLDQGWGGALPRLAHLKKQLENIARTIVDIRVHTGNMSREEMVRFVKEEALQGDQLANNMWTRTLTSSPQITTYYLGYAKVTEVYNAVRTAEHYLERARKTSSDKP